MTFKDDLTDAIGVLQEALKLAENHDVPPEIRRKYIATLLLTRKSILADAGIVVADLWRVPAGQKAVKPAGHEQPQPKVSTLAQTLQDKIAELQMVERGL